MGSRSKNQHITGTVSRTKKGFAFLLSKDSADKYFLPPQQCDDLMDGDTIEARILPHPRGPIAEFERIVERAHKSVVGTFAKGKRGNFVEVDAKIMQGPVLIDQKSSARSSIKAEPGDVVLVTLIHHPSRGRLGVGVVSKVLGQEGSIKVEIERILTECNITRPFPGEVEKESEAFGDNPKEEDWEGRKDISHLALCTIDGETAKDFDDAVYGTMEGKDFAITVAIADVSHYVKTGSNLDIEAARRATSVYFPGQCVPMLPETLSNGLCSLKPNVPRLCMAVDLLISRTGTVKKTRFYDAVMNSHARLTYNEVQAYMDDQGGPEPRVNIPPAVQASLHVLYQASRALRQARFKRGSIDFDIVEAHIALDSSGEPISIHPEERIEAHRVIEDLMVATNVAVATHLEKKQRPAIFRIHERPDPEKLRNFLRFAQGLAALKPADVKNALEGSSPKPLQNVVARFEGNEAKHTLNSLLLRCMMQARYSAYNVGHFGLAEKSYLHFTSPIRRYPDLVAHRILRESFKRTRKKPTEDMVAARTSALEEVAVSCSDRERKATEAERSIDALHATWYMQDKVGVEDDGVITGVTEFGLFIKLKTYHVEGLIRTANLGPTDLQYDAEALRLYSKASGRRFSIGNVLKVRVSSVNLPERKIDFELATQPKNKTSQGKGNNVESNNNVASNKAVTNAKSKNKGIEKRGQDERRGETPKAVTSPEGAHPANRRKKHKRRAKHKGVSS
jgi:ribonuclease R